MTAPSPGAQIKREVLQLVALILLLDALFVAAYFLTPINHASEQARLVFTLVWTGAVLLLALRGLSRIRRLRLQSHGKEAPR